MAPCVDDDLESNYLEALVGNHDTTENNDDAKAALAVMKDEEEQKTIDILSLECCQASPSFNCTSQPASSSRISSTVLLAFL